MKISKVLFGLFVGVSALMGGAAVAQSDTNFFEIGPANVGGKVSCILIDRQDTNRTTVYAGAVAGGLYVRSENVEYLKQYYATRGITDSAIYGNTAIWHLISFVEDGIEKSLPVNAMVQGPDNTIYIGTGDDVFQVGSTYSPMSTVGRGVYRFDPEHFTFTRLNGTEVTGIDGDFAAVNNLDYIYRDNKLYLFATTGTGIYRWDVASESDWQAAPRRIFTGRVLDFKVARNLNMAFFTVGNQLYKIGDLTASTPVCTNISTTNTAFGGTNTAIRLAIAPSDETYLYAMVFDSLGLMESLYLTTNQQTWMRLTTSTVAPFSTNTGKTAGAMTVDPENPKRIYVGGSTLWTGEGYLDNGYFQWTKSTASERELNVGDYMTYVYSNAAFVHSGIHQIVPCYRTDAEEPYYIYYIATDGGVFSSPKAIGPSSNMRLFSNLNSGLNNVQINSIAVSPDGTITSGAHNNAVPMIESRMAHFGGEVSRTWYDDGSLGNANHDANIIWTDNGGHVAASKFQQLSPLGRRTIYVSSNNGNLGRSYADYLDYTNTQTWTSGSDFASDEIADGPAIGQIYLWETDHNTLFNDYTTYQIDTLGYVMRNGDTVWVEGSDFQILSGDVITFHNRAHADYPFEYVAPRNMRANEPVRIINPIQSRMLAIGQVKGNSTNKVAVFISWRASDFSKVWNQDEFEGGRTDASKYERLNLWAPILSINNASNNERNLYPRTMAMSSDGRFVYIAAQDLDNHRSILYRISGFEDVDYTAGAKDIQSALTDPRISTTSMLHIDTMLVDGSSWWFPRVVSSIYVDNRSGNERLVLTFEGYSTDYTNVAFVNNATTNNYSIQTLPAAGNGGIPAFCSMVEKTTGNLYVGTTDGVSIYSNGSWAPYSHLRGIAVTSMTQQTDNLPVRHSLGHTGINENKYVFAKTKWPNAMYFGTYGRGIFLDMTYVTDRVNEVSDPSDYNNAIPSVNGVGNASVLVYPNPVSDKATLAINSAEAGQALLKVYDLNGRCVVSARIGHIGEGETSYTLDCSMLPRGMYLVNVTVGSSTAASKMIVR